jgi:hypothetical protein
MFSHSQVGAIGTRGQSTHIGRSLLLALRTVDKRLSLYKNLEINGHIADYFLNMFQDGLRTQLVGILQMRMSLTK